MFVEQRTRPVLAKVCQQIGRPLEQAVLLRHHTNAVYAVGDLVIKIAPPAISLDALRRVVELVQWLTEADFPTVHLSGSFAQPLTVDGYGVTVWERLDGAIDRPVNTGDLGELLQDLHSLQLPPVALPQLDPMPGIRHSIDVSAILDDADRSLLAERSEDVADKLQGVRSPLGWGLIQSDPQVRNALRRHDGTAVLADWDGARISDRVWDVATVAVHCRRFSNDEAFQAFVDAYGWDPRDWADFENLCRFRELQMIATNARKSLPGTPAAAEVLHRVASLRRGHHELTAWRII